VTDFLTFEEADAPDLGAAGEGEIGVMIVLARHTGLRHGELGLQWTDVDLKVGRLMVRRSYVRGRIGTPKSGEPREVPLNERAVAALRKLPRRGLWVFCNQDGELLTKGACKWPLWRACKAGGLRRIGWHVLRHTFASHLVMRGVPLRVVQVLLGHASIEETERYSHLSPAISKDAVRLLEGSANRLPTSSSESRIVGESK
jgi:integrase